ncbi:MAG: MerR family transcriptional regulator [Clostridiaceae bacterium]|mgnify:FL=1|jgi:flagellar operon protein (TIGR03826 family)|nr:MerR family transcriptional regulator [Clostridiaceae bacterium]
MLDVRNCRKCGKIFNYIGGAPICPACREKEEEDFQRVKKYLYENPGASLTQVSTELEISVEMIKRFLREGRLEIANDEGNLVLECENCGRSIKTGRFCPDCERNLASGFKSAASQMKLDLDSRSTSERKSLGLRYLNKEYEKGK